MRRTASVWLLAALLFVPACRSRPEAAPQPTGTPEASAAARPSEEPATASPELATPVLHVFNVALDPTGEAGTGELRFAARTSAGLDVRATGGAVEVCPLGSLSGEPSAPCERGPDVSVDAAAVLVRAERTVTLDEITFGFVPDGRPSTTIRLPTIAPKPGLSACKDNGCNPFIELTPFTRGTLRATATWDGIATGSLSILAGRVAAHDFAMHGRPYREIASTSASSDLGPPHLRAGGTLPGTEAAIVLGNDGARPLIAPTIEATWP